MINADYVRKCSGHLRSYHGDIHIRYTQIGFPGWFGHCIGHTCTYYFCKALNSVQADTSGLFSTDYTQKSNVNMSRYYHKIVKIQIQSKLFPEIFHVFLAKNQFLSVSTARNQRTVNARSLGQTLGGQKQRRGAALCSWALGAATHRIGDLDDSWVNFSNFTNLNSQGRS